MKNTGLFLILVTILGVMILNSTPCSAVEFTVDTLVDTPDLDPGDGFCQDSQGNCSLRAAIEETNIWGGADSIVLPAGTYAVDAFLAVTDRLLISGESPQTTILDASGKVDDTTAIIHACVTPNVEIERLALTNNTGNDGGGAFVCSGTELRLTEVEVHHNTADEGGGVYAVGTLHLERSTIHDNSADYGGGIYLATYGEIHNSTISANHTTGTGAGVFMIGGATAFMYNMTITDNACNSDGVGQGIGGGIMVFDATQGVDGLVLGASIVAGNSCLSGTADDIWGLVASEDYNLIQDTAGATFYGDTAHDIVGQSAMLGPLVLNGGATKTHALLPGSPAVDASNPSYFETDQRGVSRPQGDYDDIGSFEVKLTLFDDGFESGSTSAWSETVAGS